MSFKILSASESLGAYRQLYKSIKHQYLNFSGFDAFNLKILTHQSELIKNKCDIKVYGWFKDSKPHALVTCFIYPKENLDQPSCLGNILISEDMIPTDINNFLLKMREDQKKMNRLIRAPINGHFNLGIAYPAHTTNPAQISFLTSAANTKLDYLFYESGFFRPIRMLEAFTVKVDTQLKSKIDSELASLPPHITSRPISRLFFKRDIKIYNNILNRSMTGHYGFHPLTFAEEWSLWRPFIFLINPRFFQFLQINEKEIGFCFAVPDYNQIFKNGQDVRNILRAQFSVHKIKKARIVYSCILPEHRGHGLFKFVRHKVIAEMMDAGIEEIESSYVDQANINSQKNVASTGARHSHSFNLFEFV